MSRWRFTSWRLLWLVRPVDPLLAGMDEARKSFQLLIIQHHSNPLRPGRTRRHCTPIRQSLALLISPDLSKMVSLYHASQGGERVSLTFPTGAKFRKSPVHAVSLP